MDVSKIVENAATVGLGKTDYRAVSAEDRGQGRGGGSSDRDRGTSACLEGLVRTDGHGQRLVLLDGDTVYWRGHRSAAAGCGGGRVKVMAGHRGGHYPAFACYVGAGMLDAAIIGPDRCRQPSSNHVLEAIRELDDGHGVLLLVATETSARLGYGIAAEKARSRGINVKLLAVGDDVVRHGRSRPADGGRRRGAAGIVLLCKIAGAMSARGHNLTQIFAECRRLTLDRLATVNAVIDRVGHKDVEDVLLLGTDANGRNEVRTVRTADCAATVSAVLDLLTADSDDCANFRRWRDAGVVAAVNNLGGMSDARFMAVVAEVTGQIGSVTSAVHRWYVGRMLSSAGDDHGFSVTLMDVGGCPGAGSLLGHLDHPVSASGWTYVGLGGDLCVRAAAAPPEYVRRHRVPVSDDDDDFPPDTGPAIPEARAAFVADVINHACDRIIESEDRLNAMDAADDGDCGSNWRRGAEALKGAVADGRVNAARPADALRAVGRLLEMHMAGTSGSLLSAFFRSFSLAFLKYATDRPPLGPAAWLDGIGQGVLAVKMYGMCRPGDRTLLDALAPALRGMETVMRESENPVHLLSRAAKEADGGCRRVLGRVPDPGAYGVKIVLDAILEKCIARSAGLKL